MLYLFIALYAEAAVWIRELGLKKEKEAFPFDVFSSPEGIRLVLTGTGSTAAAVAVSSICARYGVAGEDIILNIGTCAGSSPGKLFLIHKIVCAVTRRSFYPDILYCHGWEEASLVTTPRALTAGLRQEGVDARCGTKPARRHLTLPNRMQEGVDARCGTEPARRHLTPPNRMQEGADARCGTEHSVPGRFAVGEKFSGERQTVYDMEGAGIYQAGAYFVSPHQMIFLKIVSDAGQSGSVTAQDVRELMENKKEEILTFIRMLKGVQGEKRRLAAAADSCAANRMEFVSRLCKDLHCSETMRGMVFRLFAYLAAAGVDYRRAVEGLYEAGKLPCRDKREGKRCFEELKQKLYL